MLRRLSPCLGGGLPSLPWSAAWRGCASGTRRRRGPVRVETVPDVARTASPPPQPSTPSPAPTLQVPTPEPVATPQAPTTPPPTKAAVMESASAMARLSDAELDALWAAAPASQAAVGAQPPGPVEEETVAAVGDAIARAEAAEAEAARNEMEGAIQYGRGASEYALSDAEALALGRERLAQAQASGKKPRSVRLSRRIARGLSPALRPRMSNPLIARSSQPSQHSLQTTTANLPVHTPTQVPVRDSAHTQPHFGRDTAAPAGRRAPEARDMTVTKERGTALRRRSPPPSAVELDATDVELALLTKHAVDAAVGLGATFASPWTDDERPRPRPHSRDRRRGPGGGRERRPPQRGSRRDGPVHGSVDYGGDPRPAHDRGPRTTGAVRVGEKRAPPSAEIAALVAAALEDPELCPADAAPAAGPQWAQRRHPTPRRSAGREDDDDDDEGRDDDGGIDASALAELSHHIRLEGSGSLSRRCSALPQRSNRTKGRPPPQEPRGAPAPKPTPKAHGRGPLRRSGRRDDEYGGVAISEEDVWGTRP